MSGSILERIYILDHLLYLLTLLLNVIEIFKILLRENIRSMKNAYEIVLILSTTTNKLSSGWFIWCDISLQYYIIVNLYIYINWITLQQYYITMFGALVRVRLFWFQIILGYHFTPYRVSGCAWKIEFSRKQFHLIVCFMALTQKIFYTSIFASNDFRTQTRRERERESTKRDWREWDRARAVELRPPPQAQMRRWARAGKI